MLGVFSCYLSTFSLHTNITSYHVRGSVGSDKWFVIVDAWWT